MINRFFPFFLFYFVVFLAIEVDASFSRDNDGIWVKQKIPRDQNVRSSKTSK